MSKYKELDDLEKIIDSMDNDLRRKYLKWLKLSNGFLKFEKRFKPERNAKYEPGDVLEVNFGFNVGSEFGGRHFAVVIESNARSAGGVMVIPLSSCASEKEVKSPNVYLGVIDLLNDQSNPDFNEEQTHSFAVLNQIRQISKMRISTPTKPTDEKINIGSTLLEKIYANINDVYTGKYPEKEEPHTIKPI